VDRAAAIEQNQMVRAFFIAALASPLLAALAWGADARRPVSKPAEPQAPEAAPAAPDAVPCRPMPAKAKIKVNLKPDIEVADLVTWYSRLTCTPLIVSSGTPTAGKKVTLMTPTPMSRSQLDHLFLSALDSVGLTLEADGKFLYVIEAAKARHSNTPVVPAR
jgi:type II secretory pathway component GspD/PulD (secretin)